MLSATGGMGLRFLGEMVAREVRMPQNDSGSLFEVPGQGCSGTLKASLLHSCVGSIVTGHLLFRTCHTQKSLVCAYQDLGGGGLWSGRVTIGVKPSLRSSGENEKCP